MNQIAKPFDLGERTAKFGEHVILFCKSAKKDTVSSPLISQLVRSATSIGANYMEANNASSKKDFTNKIFIAKKEAQETQHWLRMLGTYYEEKETIRLLWKEAHELTMILQKITSTLRK